MPKLRIQLKTQTSRFGATTINTTTPRGASAEQCQNSSQVLVIEDDPDIASLIKLHLQDAGFVVTVTHNGEFGLYLAQRQRFALVILDLTLPSMDGLEICARLHAAPERPLVLMVTSRVSERERVIGLESGADDYLTKPFGFFEMVARVRALLRRAPVAITSQRPTGAVSIGKLLIDTDTREVELRGKPIKLTAKEFDLLNWFASHPGRVFSRTALLDAVWGAGYEGFEHTVSSHLNRLRAKLEDDGAQPKILRTERGVGYKLVPPG